MRDSRLFKFGKARIDRSLLMSEVDFFPASINSLDFGLHHSLSYSVSPFLSLSLCFVHPYPAHVPLGSECIKFSSAWPMSDMHSHKDSGTNFVIYTLPMLINFFMFSTSDDREKKMGNFPYRCLSVTALRREAILKKIKSSFRLFYLCPTDEYTSNLQVEQGRELSHRFSCFRILGRGSCSRYSRSFPHLLFRDTRWKIGSGNLGYTDPPTI